jgi:hypothetical protein
VRPMNLAQYFLQVDQNFEVGPASEATSKSERCGVSDTEHRLDRTIY